MATPTVGIDDFSAYLPQLYLPIRSLAEERRIDYDKLSKGLGLHEMAVPDAREDAATMAANAVLDLMHKNDLEPGAIGRLYLGTESALDRAKPTATYVLDMLQDHFADTYGPNCFLHCDVVDLTFACIGAVDALQICLEWAGGDAGRKAVVVASDKAKYEMGSTGEYTQGAGAIAMLVKQQPRLLRIDPEFGVATRPAHDFFKPVRQVRKKTLIREVIDLLPGARVADYDLDALEEQLAANLEVKGILDCNEQQLSLHKDTPVFDGAHSNEAYQARVREALMDFRRRHGTPAAGQLTTTYEALAFHLPYAYQGRRMFSEIFMEEMKAGGDWESFIERNQLDVPCAEDYADREKYLTRCSEFLRQVTKTPDYRAFAERYIAPGDWASSRVGNMYAGSVFLSLMAILEGSLEGKDLAGKRIAVFAYGSGSKAKFFGATVGEEYRRVAETFGLRKRLDHRQEIDYATYERLHRCGYRENVSPLSEGSFFLADIHDRGEEMEGARHYGYAARAV